MHRRQAITVFGGIAVWPFVASAQQLNRARRIGVLTGFSEGDLFGESLLAAFRQELASLGWKEGRDVEIDIRWGNVAQHEQMRNDAVGLVRTRPDVIVVHGSRALAAVRMETDSIPIIFASVADPVASGYVNSLAKPGGNVTGFTNYNGSPSPKLLEILKDVAPNLKRVGFMITSDNLAAARQREAMENVAQSFAVKITSLLPRSLGAIASTIETFAQDADGGLVVTSDLVMVTYRELIVAEAVRHRLPAIYQDRSFVVVGGLMSYSVDRRESYRQVARYADRILKGARPADLPIQQPQKFEFLLNLKAAKAIGLDPPRTVLARADEIIE